MSLIQSNSNFNLVEEEYDKQAEYYIRPRLLKEAHEEHMKTQATEWHNFVKTRFITDYRSICQAVAQALQDNGFECYYDEQHLYEQPDYFDEGIYVGSDKAEAVHMFNILEKEFRPDFVDAHIGT